MSTETNFYDGVIKGIKLSTNTFAPAKVIKFHEDSMEADIEILFLTRRKDGSFFQYPLVERAPVLGMRYKTPTEEIMFTPSLKKDDLVFVAFAQRALDNLQSKPFDPGTRRTHAIKDAVVLGVFNL